MKKRFISLFLILLISLIVLVGCGKDASNQDVATPDEVKSTETVLEFGKNDYNDSIQVNQEKIDWATYDDLPAQISLDSVLEFSNNNSSRVIDVPNWERIEFNDSVVLNNDPDFIIVTFKDSPKDIFMNSISNIKEFKDLTSFKVKSTTIENIGSYKATINKGTCCVNNKNKNEKLFTSCILENDNESFCIIAVTQDKAAHTVDILNDTIIKMARSVTDSEVGSMLGQDAAEELVEEAEDVNQEE